MKNFSEDEKRVHTKDVFNVILYVINAISQVAKFKSWSLRFHDFDHELNELKWKIEQKVAKTIISQFQGYTDTR